MDVATATLILRLVELVAFGLTHAPEVMLEVQALADEIRTMVDEDRNPTPEEWAALDARLAQARVALAAQA